MKTERRRARWRHKRGAGERAQRLERDGERRLDETALGRALEQQLLERGACRRLRTSSRWPSRVQPSTSLSAVVGESARAERLAHALAMPRGGAWR